MKTYKILPKIDGTNANEVSTITEIVTSLMKNINLNQTNTPDHETLIVAIGGDGTMLKAMRDSLETNSIVAGINLGKIGFLTDFTRLNILEIQQAIENGNIEERTVLTLLNENRLTPIVACNEFSISRTESDTMLKYHLTVNDMDAGTHRANGLLISVPTGSTAYTMAAGGALMFPNMNAMQIIPIACATLTSRPIIVGGDSIIELQVGGGLISVKADGQKINLGEHKIMFLTISQFSKKVRVLHSKDWNYFRMLSEKLGWQHS